MCSTTLAGAQERETRAGDQLTVVEFDPVKSSLDFSLTFGAL